MEEEVAASVREDTQVVTWGQEVETGWTPGSCSWGQERRADMRKEGSI